MISIEVEKKNEKAMVSWITGGIPKSELDVFAVNLNIGNVVLKDGGNINLSAAIEIKERA